MSRADGPIFRALQQPVAQSGAACRRVDGQESDVRAVLTLDRRDDAVGGVAEDHGGLLVRTEGARQLLGRGRVCH